MLDPRKSLAVDAPPVAPYDDGFSTDSEDFSDAEESAYELSASPLRVAASRSVRSAATAKNQLTLGRQQIHAVPAPKTAKHDKEAKLQAASVIAATIEEVASKQAAGGLKTTRNGGESKREEHCKSCQGYLTPMAERLRIMKMAALQRTGGGPPLSRQCYCCHITYPLVALTDESRERSCSQPRCYMCNWAARAAKKVSSVGAKRTVTGAMKETGGVAGQASHTVVNRGKEEVKKEINGQDTSTYCRNCNGKLPSLRERLSKMHTTATQLRTQTWRVSPPSRQCSCCYITYPLASLTEASRSARPICYSCNRLEAPTSASSGASPSSSAVVADASAVEGKRQLLPEADKTQQTIIVEGGEDDEEGELVEENECKCCHGKLTPLAKRLQVMKDAVRQHVGKGPPPSRQCACCRITYPSAALTKKSRKLVRVVPICLKCCRAGGSAIYEMLAVSDEFVESFKVENPTMARQLLAKKASGHLEVLAENQRKRVMKSTKPPSLLKEIQAQTRKLNQHVKGLKAYALPPLYRRYGVVARKHIGAPRLILGMGNYEASQGEVQFDSSGNVETKDQQAPLHESQRRRNARWLKQFEIINGKTARERRLEARNETKEQQLERRPEK